MTSIERGFRCDFVGIILKVGKALSFKNKKGESVSRINIQLGDSDLISVNLCLWGDRLVSEFEQAVRQKGWHFDKSRPLILLVKSAKVSDFGDKSLNAYADDGQIYINPLMPSAGALEIWLEG
jgi:hypothetical protein